MTEPLIRLQAYGMTVLGEGLRPLLLLKEEGGDLTLPVPLNPLEAGVTLGQSNRHLPALTPHKVTEHLFQSMDFRIRECQFTEFRNQNQMVRLKLENHPFGLQEVLVRADEAMSLCLHLKVPLFASKEFILQSRVYVADLQEQALHLQSKIRHPIKNQNYLM